MATSQSRPEVHARGFTLIEVLFALVILSTGLVALGSLAAQNLNGTAESRYMSLASTLASEKLEDLNRWPTWDPHVCVTSGTVGSLTSDVQSASVTCNGVTDTVDYYDDVEISDNQGAVCQTVSSVSNGAETYASTCHNPNGTMTQTSSSTLAAANVGTIDLHRRWTIEANQPTTGVKRITVLVTLENGYVQSGVSFQMSMVRP